MAKTLLDAPALRALQEYLVELSVFREIQELFEDSGIMSDPDFDRSTESSVRRGLTKSYFASLDLTEWADVRKLLSVFEKVLVQMEFLGWEEHYGEGRKKHFERMVRFLARDGFTYEGGKLRAVAATPHLRSIEQHAQRFDAHHLQDQIRRIEESVQDNSWQAIGTSKELVETTCKTILSERNVTVDKNWDLPKLVRETCKVLKLAPDDIPDTAKASQTIKMVLGNLGTIVHGIAELRNAYGYGHGPEGRARGLSVRHARLAAGAATTLAAFLFDTHTDRESQQQRGSA